MCRLNEQSVSPPEVVGSVPSGAQTATPSAALLASPLSYR